MTDIIDESVVQEPTVEAVIEEMKVASLEQLKELPAIRKAGAVPFTIPGTDLTVMLAKCTGTTKYMMSVQQVQLAQAEDEDDRLKWLRAQNNALIKSCVVDPVLDDESIEALNEFNGDAVEALVARCVELSSDGRIKAQELLESFS